MVTRGKEMMGVLLDRLEPHMAQSTFIAGEKFSIADITGFFTIRMTGAVGMDISESHANIARWFAAVSARPAFQL